MPLLEAAIRQYLISEGITAPIYPLQLPGKTDYPAITYQMISNHGHHDIPYDFPRIQITVWSPQLLTAKQLAQDIEGKLIRYKGVMGGYKIKQIVKEPSPGDLYDREGGESGLFYIPVDYRVIYEGS